MDGQKLADYRTRANKRMDYFMLSLRNLAAEFGDDAWGKVLAGAMSGDVEARRAVAEVFRQMLVSAEDTTEEIHRLLRKAEQNAKRIRALAIYAAAHGESSIISLCHDALHKKNPAAVTMALRHFHDRVAEGVKFEIEEETTQKNTDS